jgi:glutathione peroxidase
MRRTFLILLSVPAILLAIVLIDNRKSADMTIRQKILKTIYPFFFGMTRFAGAKKMSYGPEKKVDPPVSFHSLTCVMNNGEVLDMSTLKGKKVLLVNTASDCGYTPQYEALQRLQDRQEGKLLVVGFPANDFKEQEKGSDQEIAEFCKVNFGVKFPLAAKSSVVKGATQNNLFRWLSDSSMNGWNDRAPVWNFSKYLVDEDGRLIGYFEPSVDPGGQEISEALGLGN